MPGQPLPKHRRPSVGAGVGEIEGKGADLLLRRRAALAQHRGAADEAANIV